MPGGHLSLDSVSAGGWVPCPVPAPTGHLQPGVLGSGDGSSSAHSLDHEAVLAARRGWFLSVS